jgi:hypothetical protein
MANFYKNYSNQEYCYAQAIEKVVTIQHAVAVKDWPEKLLCDNSMKCVHIECGFHNDFSPDINPGLLINYLVKPKQNG